MQIVNKKAQFNYKLYDRFEAGIVLNGGEVKAVKNQGADLSNSYAKILNREVYLINANIPVKDKKNYDSTRTRKLLLHKKEVISLLSIMKAKKLTLVPTKLYTKKRLVKLELALAKTKREFEKKESIKRKDLEREIEQELKNR